MTTKMEPLNGLYQPPHIPRIPETLGYMRQYAMDTAYISQQGPSESSVTYKRRIYNTMNVLLTTNTELPEISIALLWPNTDWTQIWKNVHEMLVSATVKVTWYKASHDIIPTHERLHKIRLVPTDLCRQCNRKDTLPHRLIDCGGPQMWEWTLRCIAIMLRIDWRNIPSDWLLRSSFKLWPPPRYRAVLWLLDNFVVFRLNTRRTLTQIEYYDFLLRARWKIYTTGNRAKHVGNYLVIITEAM
jgi:hypothetical protein